jgi:acyl-CoA synthetase (AMP-forming)/AMP-acid ligase II
MMTTSTEHSLGQAVLDALSQRPDRTIRFASLDHPSVHDFAALRKDSLRVAAALDALGLQPGDTIVVQLPNWHENIVLWFAALVRGLIFVPVVHIYGATELRDILVRSKARALFVPDRWRRIDFQARVRDVGQIDPQPLTVVVGTPTELPGAISWEGFLNAGANRVSAVEPAEPTTLAALIFTSGTTSVPKGVLHSHYSLACESETANFWVEGASHRGLLVGFPAGHVAGLTSMLMPVLCDFDVVFMDQWDAGQAVDLIARYELGWSTGAPFHLMGILDSAKPEQLEKLQRYLLGGANVPPSLVERAEQAGITAFRAYGSTEHPTVTSGHATDTLADRAYSDGQLLPGCSIRIVNEDGIAVPDGEDGEVLTRGPDLMTGYLGLEREGFTDDGWFKTGDIGIITPSGRLAIVDRKKDVIIRAGENISSREVEDLVRLMPAISDVAAVGWPHERYGEQVGVFVILATGATLNLDTIRDHFLALGIARAKTPEHLRVVDDFPRTASGKVQKPELRSMITG